MSLHRTNPKAGWAELDKLPKGPNGRPLCRRCDQEVPNGRRSFCCAPCIHEWKIRTNPGYVREQVAQRDRGVCAACGLDTQTMSRDHQELKALGFPRDGHRWEADHILPVSEGGGECGLDNYRTLCIPCHRHATNELRRRRALTRTHVHNQGVLIMKPEILEATETAPATDGTNQLIAETVPSMGETVQDHDVVDMPPPASDPAPAEPDSPEPLAQDPARVAALDIEDDDMIEQTWGHRHLEREMTDQERLEIGMEMADALKRVQCLEEEKKDYGLQMKAQIERSYETATTLGDSLRKGKREGDVNVSIVKNWHDGTYTVTRTDTQEILERRAMTYEERQQVLPMETETKSANEPMEKRGEVDKAGTFEFPGPGESAHYHAGEEVLLHFNGQEASTEEHLSPVDAMAMTAAGKVGNA